MKPDLLQRAIYENRMAAHGETPEGVGWRDKKAQEVRFEQLLKVIPVRSDFSVNDVGCGLGHLYGYMNNNGFHRFAYRGYDISRDMIARARNRHKGDSTPEFHAITRVSDIKSADFCLASGILNYKGDASESVWLGYVLQTMDDMNGRSVKGFSFNMLTKYSDLDYMEDALYYADPCFVFDFCKRNYSKNVALLHDYDEYDFTIIVRKEAIGKMDGPEASAEKG
jgi:SAM-dependent methyltransferase